MSPIRLYVEWFWFFCIIIIALNGIAIWRRTKSYRHANPSLTAGYRVFIMWACLLCSIPWVFLGIAQVTGEIETIMDVADLISGPWTAAFFISGAIITVRFVIYVFLRSGAEKLTYYPGLLSPRFVFDQPAGWRALAIIIPLSQIVGISVLLMFGDLAPR